MMFCIASNPDVFSLIILIMLPFLCFIQFRNYIIKYFNIIMIVMLLLKYALALSNLSDKNSPISFPYLYDKGYYKWNNPWYKELPWYIEKDSEGNED